MRACLIAILITCSCSKDKTPTPPEKEIAERPTIVSRDGGVPTPAPKDAIKTGPSASGVLALVSRDGGAFASLTGTSEFSSSGGVYVDSAVQYLRDVLNLTKSRFPFWVQGGKANCFPVSY